MCNSLDWPAQDDASKVRVLHLPTPSSPASRTIPRAAFTHQTAIKVVLTICTLLRHQ